jgi:hypothetical protein
LAITQEAGGHTEKKERRRENEGRDKRTNIKQFKKNRQKEYIYMTRSPALSYIWTTAKFKSTTILTGF